MDTAFTFSTTTGIKATLYVAPEFDAPFELALTLEGKPVTFLRVSDRSLECGQVGGVSGSCTSFDCHRTQLGDCKCGRHDAPVRFTRATP